MQHKNLGNKIKTINKNTSGIIAMALNNELKNGEIVYSTINNEKYRVIISNNGQTAKLDYPTSLARTGVAQEEV